MAVSPAEVSQFNADTTFRLDLDLGLSVDVQLGDDPNYMVGDTSAKFKTETPLDLGTADGTLVQSIKLSWKNGIMVINVTTNLSASGSEPLTHPALAALLDPKSARDKNHGGFQEVLALEVLDDNLDTIVASEPIIRCSQKLTNKVFENPDGSGNELISANVKSVDFIFAP